jgi:hypothetical protein
VEYTADAGSTAIGTASPMEVELDPTLRRRGTMSSDSLLGDDDGELFPRTEDHYHCNHGDHP